MVTTCLPQHLAADRASVSLTAEDEKLIVPARQRYRLADLLAGKDNGKKHAEVDWAKPEGNEIW